MRQSKPQSERRSERRSKRHWLMKSEPGTFSADDLARAPDQTTPWDGVRNYQARNLLRDELRPGDEVLFYHSSADPTGVAALARVVRAGYPEPAQFDPRSKYFDPGADPAEPRWYCVDVRLVRKLPRVVTLAELKAAPTTRDMMVCRKGARLSVQPVSPEEFRAVVELSRR
jgi:predicted RNA-binding protein with PUA-like domain